MADAANTAKSNSGATVSLACNLPHGLAIEHHGRKLTIAGANHPRALQTSTALNGKWGVTSNVDEEWFDDWCKEARHPAVANGNIIKNTAAKIEGQATEMGDAVATGAEPLDPLKPGGGVEPVPQEENED